MIIDHKFPEQADRHFGLPPNLGTNAWSKTLRLSSRMTADAFVVLDFAMVLLTALLAKYLYLTLVLESESGIAKYAVAGAVCAAISYTVFRGNGLYDRSRLVEGKRQSGRVVLSLALSFLILIAIAYVLKVSSEFSRGWFGVWFALSGLALLATSWLHHPVYNWLVDRGYIVRRIALVGNAASAERLMHELRKLPDTQIVGVFASEPSPNRAAVGDLIRIGQSGMVDEIIVLLPSLAEPWSELVDLVGMLPVDIRLYVEQAPSSVPIRDVTHVGNVTLLGVKNKPVREWGHLVKAGEDYILSAVALVLLAPVMGLIALAIKLDSRGPVFFRQQRHGYNHRIIRVLKFRTMSVMEDGDRIVQAQPGDQRVTRVGRFLRKTSLDELPQIINVLRGEMSLVGPRPHALSHNDHYRSMLARYPNRHIVKPGITGWAQVNGFRGPTDDVQLMDKRVRYDLEYIEKWSFWWDIEILLRTVLTVLSQRNAC